MSAETAKRVLREVRDAAPALQDWDDELQFTQSKRVKLGDDGGEIVEL